MHVLSCLSSLSQGRPPCNPCCRAKPERWAFLKCQPAGKPECQKRHTFPAMPERLVIRLPDRPYENSRYREPERPDDRIANVAKGQNDSNADKKVVT